MNITRAEEVDFSLEEIQTVLDHDLVWMVVLLTMLLYDNLLTLAKEVQFIWKQDFSGKTVIFLANRYLSLSMMILTLIGTLTGKGCSAISAILLVLEASLRFAQGSFAALRIYAICNRNVIVPLIILVLTFIPLVMSIVTNVLQGPYVKGCLVLLPGYYAIVWITARAMSLASDTLVVVMTWIKTAGIKREATRCKINVPISSLLLRDGTVHFVLLLGMSITDIVLTFFLPSENNTNIAIFTFRSITLSHFMMNLRQVYLECEGNQALGTLRSSSIRFATSVVGNLGAPLSLGQEGESIISMERRERSHDPLTSGLYPTTRDGEERALLRQQSHSDSPTSTASDWQELFDDEAYGRKLMYHVHRGDTLNSVEVSCCLFMRRRRTDIGNRRSETRISSVNDIEQTDNR